MFGLKSVLLSIEGYTVDLDFPVFEIIRDNDIVTITEVSTIAAPTFEVSTSAVPTFDISTKTAASSDSSSSSDSTSDSSSDTSSDSSSDSSSSKSSVSQSHPPLPKSQPTVLDVQIPSGLNQRKRKAVHNMISTTPTHVRFEALENTDLKTFDFGKLPHTTENTPIENVFLYDSQYMPKLTNAQKRRARKKATEEAFRQKANSESTKQEVQQIDLALKHDENLNDLENHFDDMENVQFEQKSHSSPSHSAALISNEILNDIEISTQNTRISPPRLVKSELILSQRRRQSPVKSELTISQRRRRRRKARAELMRQQLDTLMQETPKGDLQDGNNNHEAEKPNSVIGGLTNNLHPNNPEPLTSFNVGMKIAFKQIEMSKEYTPEISNFKVLLFNEGSRGFIVRSIFRNDSSQNAY